MKTRWIIAAVLAVAAATGWQVIAQGPDTTIAPENLVEVVDASAAPKVIKDHQGRTAAPVEKDPAAIEKALQDSDGVTVMMGTRNVLLPLVDGSDLARLANDIVEATKDDPQIAIFHFPENSLLIKVEGDGPPPQDGKRDLAQDGKAMALAAFLLEVMRADYQGPSRPRAKPTLPLQGIGEREGWTPTDLDEEFKRLEEQAAKTAGELRELKTTDGWRNLGVTHQLRSALRSTVSRLFEIRQHVQRRELAEYQNRLARIEQQINDREPLKDAIIDRRVEELINPTLAWEPMESADAKTKKIGGVAAPAEPTVPPAKVDGMVLSVDNQRELGIVSMGSEDGMRVGTALRVLHDSTYLGRVTVVKTNKDTSLVRIEEENAAMPIRRGDRVTAALPSEAEEAARALAWDLLGTRFGDYTVFVQSRFGLPIQELRTGGPASQSELRVGDILVGLERWEIRSLRNLGFALEHVRPHSEQTRDVKVFVVRDGKTISAMITITAPKDGDRAATPPAETEEFAVRGSVHVLFKSPTGATLSWTPRSADGRSLFQVPPGRTFGGARKSLPASFVVTHGHTVLFHLREIPGRDGLRLFGSLEIAPLSEPIFPFVASSAIPLEITEEDLDRAASGEQVVKLIWVNAEDELRVVHYPSLEPGADPVDQAQRRGVELRRDQGLAILRLSNRYESIGASEEHGPHMELSPRQPSDTSKREKEVESPEAPDSVKDILNPPSKTPSGISLSFASPNGAMIAWTARSSRSNWKRAARLPAQVVIDRSEPVTLSLHSIPHPYLDLQLTVSVEIPQLGDAAEAFVASNAIPLEITTDDLDQVASGNHLVKVVYLSKGQGPEASGGRPETLVSTRLEPGQDPVAEAQRRGHVVALLRLSDRMPEKQDDVREHGGDRPRRGAP